MRILCKVAYDGSQYGGWQIQNNVNTVQGEIHVALEKIFNESLSILGSSRTDAGVHAEAQYFCFQVVTNIPVARIAHILNLHLPEDIVVLSSVYVPDEFHPIVHSIEKGYRYEIDNGLFKDPLRRKYSWHISKPLNVEAMREAAKVLMGTHDFKSFCVEGCQVKTTVRTIHDIQIITNGNQILLHVSGNGFLHNMVRIITGTLVAVGVGRFTPKDIQRILNGLNRQDAGPTAPPHGLVLEYMKLINTEIFQENM